MQIEKFEYSQNWPITFSNNFFHFLNKSIGGNQIFIEHQGMVLPIIVRKKHFFKVGYCIHPPLKNGEKLTKKEEQYFFDALSVFLKENKVVDFLQAPLHIENFHQIPDNAIGHKIGIIRLDLKDKTEEEVFSTFKPIYRNLIRKALKEEVVIKFGMDCFDDFYDLYKTKLIDEKAPYDSYQQIHSFVSELVKTDQMMCAVAYVNGKKDAGIVNIHDQKNACYMWSGTAANAHSGSLRLLQWEIIKKYLVKGIENYRMGGAREGEYLNEKHKRLLAFKTGFGCRIEEGYHFTYIANPIKYKLYNGLLKLKSRLR